MNKKILAILVVVIAICSTTSIGSYNITSFVGINKDKGTPLAVVVCGSDANLLKEYANTITFD